MPKSNQAKEAMNNSTHGRRLPARTAQRPVRARGGFTLIEILVVLAIIAILAALLFPAFKRAQESSKQANCASNLQQIYTAVMLYRSDEGKFPVSLAVLLPSTDKLDNSPGSPTPVATAASINNVPCNPDGTCPNARGTGFLKSSGVLVCPDDDTNATVPRSSYSNVATSQSGSAAANTVVPAPDLGRYVWNYWGYKNDGFAYQQSELPADTLHANYITALTANNERKFLANPALAYDASTNKVNPNAVPRLANRNAPGETIITHCVYHRLPTSNLADPFALSSDVANASGARDIVLRLDGKAEAVEVTTWKDDKWVKQNR